LGLLTVTAVRKLLLDEVWLYKSKHQYLTADGSTTRGHWHMQNRAVGRRPPPSLDSDFFSICRLFPCKTRRSMYI